MKYIIYFVAFLLPINKSYILGQSSDSIAAVRGDTVLLTISNSNISEIRWQQRTSYFTIWQDIPSEHDSHLYIPVTSTSTNLNYRAKVRFQNDSCFTYSKPKFIEIFNKKSDLPLGVIYAGGYIFNYEQGMLFILCPRQPWLDNYVSWGCNNKNIPGATGQSIGDGKKNTVEILKSCHDSTSASFVSDTMSINGFNDWYVPSIGELERMYNTIFYSISHGYKEGWYWSSTQNDNTSAWFYSCYKEKPYKQVRAKNEVMYFMPIRDINENENITHKIDLPIPGNESIFNIEMLINDTFPNKRKVLFVDNLSNEDKLSWNFGTGSNIISGKDEGPYEISYNYGGFTKINAIKGNNQCRSEKHTSAHFKNSIFKEIKTQFAYSFMGDMDYGDFNNDGLTDILITGSNSCKIFTYKGLDTFTELKQVFPSLSKSSCSLGDFNNDNYLDFAVCGFNSDDSTVITKVYQNLGDLEFKEVNFSFTGVQNGFVEWIDLENDGTIELLVSGQNKEGMPVSKTYRGFKNNVIEEFRNGVLPLWNSHGSFGDYNNDGFQDLVITGLNGTTRYTQVYKNENGNLTLTNIKLQGVEKGCAIWGDYNNDGKLDIMVSGAEKEIKIDTLSPSQIYVKFGEAAFWGIYKNEGQDNFRFIPPDWNYYEYVYSHQDFGDYDNDGDLDYVIAGVPHIDYILVGIGGNVQFTYQTVPWLFTNTNLTNFRNCHVDIPHFPEYITNLDTFFYHVQIGFETSNIKLFDYNNDGKLDIFRDGNLCTIYKNVSSFQNEPPTTPTHIKSESDCKKAILHWSESTDDHTASINLMYEIYVGSEAGKSDIISKFSHNQIRDTTFMIYELEPGTYYWGVRAIDQAFSKSEYSEEQSFVISPKPEKPIITRNGNTLISSSPSGNQWYDEQGILVGETKQILHPLKNGKYYCVTRENGCASDTSEAFLFIFLENKNPIFSNIKLYPNPANEALYIDGVIPIQPLKYKLFDVFGQLIKEGKILSDLYIPITELNPSCYKLILIKEEGSMVEWFFKL